MVEHRDHVGDRVVDEQTTTVGDRQEAPAAVALVAPGGGCGGGKREKGRE